MAGTLVVVYGFMVTPIGWEHAPGIWPYALAWLVVNVAAKRLAYDIVHNRGER